MGKRKSATTEVPLDINSLVSELETANEEIKMEIENEINNDDKKTEYVSSDLDYTCRTAKNSLTP